MIRSVHLERFKCFTDEKIQFGKLSVLAGTNGAGKSSVIQSLLLFAQTIKPHFPH
ncbi:MAG: ATP-binding protein [Firmicutes bacterium]|nr:ATP-binding protein [Bacillota bacterium]